MVFKMNKEQLHRLTGSLQQIAYARPVRYQQGRSGGTLAYEVKNGPLHLNVTADKCMDIAELAYKGVNLSFLSKPGLAGRTPDITGEDSRRSIMGGLLFTCGSASFGQPCSEGGAAHPMHGRMRNIPAEHVSSDAFWDGDKYTLCVSGEMREATLFGENIVLRRKIQTVYGEKSLTIEDTVENQAFRDEPLMLLYHFNFGYPLLAPGADVVLPSSSARLLDTIDGEREWRPVLKDKIGWNTITPPSDNQPEQVFDHALCASDSGQTFAAVVNDELGLGVRIDFDKAALPHFFQWKSMASGDYALGLEPANASVIGRAYQKAHGGLPMLAPFEKKAFSFTVTVLEGRDELNAVRNEALSAANS